MLYFLAIIFVLLWCNQQEKIKMKLHYFSPLHAEWFASVEKALIINHLLYWQKLNTDNGVHEHDGRVWVAATAASIHKRMSYLRPSSINRWLKELVNDEILVMYQRGYDRTIWYSVVVENLPKETDMESDTPERVSVKEVSKNGLTMGEALVITKVEEILPEKAFPKMENAITNLGNATPNLENAITNLGNLLDNVLDNVLDNGKKYPYGESGVILLTKKEAETFLNKHGEVFFTRCLEKLDNWIMRQPDGKERNKYLKQNHYYVLNGWVQKTVRFEIQKEQENEKYRKTLNKAYNGRVPVKLQLNDQKVNLD